MNPFAGSAPHVGFGWCGAWSPTNTAVGKRNTRACNGCGPWNVHSSHSVVVTPTALLQGSHAQEFGAMQISREMSSDFEGSHAAVAARGRDDTAVLQHDADLVHLRHRMATGVPESAAAAERELQAELRERSRIDRAVLAAAGAVLTQHLPAGQLHDLRSVHGATSYAPRRSTPPADMWPS